VKLEYLFLDIFSFTHLEKPRLSDLDWMIQKNADFNCYFIILNTAFKYEPDDIQNAWKPNTKYVTPYIENRKILKKERFIT